MANKRNLKHNINCVCSELFAECLAAYLTVREEDVEQIDELLKSILRLQREYVSRIAHPEPGIKANEYYASLTEDFKKQVAEVTDNIQALA